MGLHAPVKGGGNFTPHPKGQFVATCVDIHNVGLTKSTFNGNEKMVHKVDFYFFCGKWKKLDSGEAVPLLVRERFTLSLGDKARLLPFVESWRGEAFESMADRMQFDLDSLLHVHAQIQVVHRQVGENTYANISSIMAAPEGLVGPGIPEGYVRVQDRPPRDGDAPRKMGPVEAQAQAVRQAIAGKNPPNYEGEPTPSYEDDDDDAF